MFVGRETGKYLHDIDVDYDRLAGSHRFLDDYIKVFKKDKEGLHGRFKIVGQVGLGLIVGLTLFLSPDVVIRENVAVQTPGADTEVVKYESENIKSTQTTIPFSRIIISIMPIWSRFWANMPRPVVGLFSYCLRFCGDSRFERRELDRRSRRFSDGNFGHHGFDIGHIGLSVGAYSVRIVFEYHVYTGERGTGRFRQRFYGGDNRFCGIMRSRLRCLWAIRVASRWAVLLPCSLFVYIRSC